MATNYQRGRAFEYRTRDALVKEFGAAYVMRAAQSKGVFDLAAFFGWVNPGTIHETFPQAWLVQCKRDGRLSAAERERCVELAQECGVPAYLAKAGPKGRGVVFERLRKEGT